MYKTHRLAAALFPGSAATGVRMQDRGKIREVKILALLCCFVTTATADQFGDFTYYEDKDSTLTITDYPTNAVGPVAIPAMIAGKPVTRIGYAAFSGCSRLTSVAIPNSVTRIEHDAFKYCSGLAGVALPAGVASVGRGAFANCSGLNSISVDPANPTYSSENGVLLNKLKTMLVAYPANRQGAYTIPAGVTRIEDLAFTYCRGLTGVTIPLGITSIGYGVFSGCSALTNVTIPPGVTHIGLDAFDSCSGLQSVAIPPSVTTISDHAFSGCRGLTTITIPVGVTIIGGFAFAHCSGLTSVTIPSSVTTLRGGAFFNCERLSAAVFTGHAPAVEVDSIVFSGTAPGFTVYFFDVKIGFTSPTWMGYPSVNMGAETPLKTWLVAGGFPYDSNLQSDPNGDGVNLLMAYALNLDPNQTLSGSLPQPVITSGEMSLSFYAGTAGITYTVAASGDMVNWSTDGVTISGADANQIRTATVARTGRVRFIRLAVSH